MTDGYAQEGMYSRDTQVTMEYCSAKPWVNQTPGVIQYESFPYLHINQLRLTRYSRPFIRPDTRKKFYISF